MYKCLATINLFLHPQSSFSQIVMNINTKANKFDSEFAALLPQNGVGGEGGVGVINDPEVGHVATQSDRFALTSSELVWRSTYNRIQKLGYQLRERYNPEWIPSWRKAGYTDRWLEEHDFLWASFEDSISVRSPV
jgi:hypothetical protein